MTDEQLKILNDDIEAGRVMTMTVEEYQRINRLEPEGQLNTTDNIIRFLDSEYIVVLFKNELGMYSAAMGSGHDFNITDDGALECPEAQITDAETPSKAIVSLCEKFLDRVMEK